METKPALMFPIVSSWRLCREVHPLLSRLLTPIAPSLADLLPWSPLWTSCFPREPLCGYWQSWCKTSLKKIFTLNSTIVPPVSSVSAVTAEGWTTWLPPKTVPQSLSLLLLFLLLLNGVFTFCYPVTRTIMPSFTSCKSQRILASGPCPSSRPLCVVF